VVADFSTDEEHVISKKTGQYFGDFQSGTVEQLLYAVGIEQVEVFFSFKLLPRGILASVAGSLKNEDSVVRQQPGYLGYVLLGVTKVFDDVETSDQIEVL